MLVGTWPTDAGCRAHASICYNCVLSAIHPTASTAVLAGLLQSGSVPVGENPPAAVS